jgi:hypothetical protein
MGNESNTQKINIQNRDNGRKFLKYFEQITKNPNEESTKVLFKILDDNKNTEYGKKYNFKDIHSIDDYQKMVPVITYDDVVDDIERMKSGEKNILTSYNFNHMNMTSGTTGKPKLIPLTDEQTEIFMKYESQYMQGILDKYLDPSWIEGKFFSLVEGKHETLDSGITVGAASSIIADTLKGDLEPYSSLFKALYTSPPEAMVPGPDIDTKYIHLRFAIMEKSIVGIIASLYSLIVIFMNYIYNNYEILINDIEKGTIDSSIMLPDDVRESLLKKIEPMPERAEELREIFKNGPDIPFMPLIWPKLQYVVGIGTGDLSNYDKILKEQFHGGKIHSIYMGIQSSEGLWSVSRAVDDIDSILVPDSSFMEFLDLDYGDDFSKCVTIDKLEVGKIYQIVVTSFVGLYRYRMNDCVKVTGFYNETPTIEFMCRVNNTINMVAEKTTEIMFKRAVEETLDELDLTLKDYEVYPDFSAIPGQYVVMIETDDEKRFSISREELSEVYLEKLCKINPLFEMKYDMDYLQAPDVYFEKPGAQILFKEKMDAEGRGGSQFKPVHIIRTNEQAEFFLNLREL